MLQLLMLERGHGTAIYRAMANTRCSGGQGVISSLHFQKQRLTLIQITPVETSAHRVTDRRVSHCNETQLSDCQCLAEEKTTGGSHGCNEDFKRLHYNLITMH